MLNRRQFSFVSLARCCLLLIITGAMLIPAQPGLSQSSNHVTDSESAAVHYSLLEMTGSFSELYDYLHPDAQRIVPKSAVVGWYANDFAPLGPGVITVTSVQIETWTWEVTGVTYPSTAVVSFQQPFANGTVVEDVVRLVESNGEWRWFFGRSRAFVDEQVSKYGRDSVASGNVCEGAAEWWAETYPRTFPPQYFAHFFGSDGSGLSPSTMKSYGDLFGRLHDEQDRSSPPSAADALQADLLSIFGAFERAAGNFAAVPSLGGNTMAVAGAVSAGQDGMNTGRNQLLKIGNTIQVFTDKCQPLVVFVFGMGEDLPVGVLPGEVGPGIPVIDCSMFESAIDAQRFFEAAQPGDPHVLDPDGNGLACK